MLVNKNFQTNSLLMHFLKHIHSRIGSVALTLDAKPQLHCQRRATLSDAQFAILLMHLFSFPYTGIKDHFMQSNSGISRQDLIS